MTGVTDEEKEHRIREIQDYRLTHGMLLKEFDFGVHNNPRRLRQLWHRVSKKPRTLCACQVSETDLPWTTRPLAVSILPTPFPKHLFEQARELQPLFNELYLRVASDHEWLRQVLSPLIEHDPLVAGLWKIYQQVHNTDAKQHVVCGMFRSDYMIDARDSTLKQVEMNVFSASGFSHAQNVANMHQHVQRTCGSSADLPRNENIDEIANMLAEAARIYCHQLAPAQSEEASPSIEAPQFPRPKPCILMIVQPTNFNIADERPIEHALWSRNIPCYRCEWQDIPTRTQLLSDQNRTLLFHPPPNKQEPLQVSVIYYRAGYQPHEYLHIPSGMDSRLRLELSRAIKCPDIATHLTTCKTVQQALTKERVVERFLSRPSSPYADPASTKDIVALKNTFVEMLSFDSPSSKHDWMNIISDPAKVENYILKANGDGGGHNVYGGAIPAYLKDLQQEEWKKFILMRRIDSPRDAEGMLLLADDRLFQGEVVRELGVAGTCIWRRQSEGVEVLWNRCVGWTLKTKPRGVEGMMVVKGVGAMDCPNLD
ncbi:hypothetical protein CBER1_10633 [Cercospora berteroae]|uniref:Glutathione synthetase n=1 Tax=Cercospora berteroae TaxID=357750 RepID=A0A2S6CJB3_9PEZI|nr:hypothetical protein CBER1_10633 [Cercospora berteroae]